jgi:ATP-binding cassette subfamily A (ABC1) protein 3
MSQVFFASSFIYKNFIARILFSIKGSGMDPQARHSTWNMLKKFKNEKKCTILLTTHYMDEAEYLGDRIAILSKGSLRCSGSPLFLKSKYSSSYILVLTKKQSENNEDDLVKTRNLIDLVKSIVPDAKLNSNINSEITFLLCIDRIKVFPLLFEKLDRLKDDLNLISVGISAASLEQVFLK